jgi:hypothetical protein
VFGLDAQAMQRIRMGGAIPQVATAEMVRRRQGTIGCGWNVTAIVDFKRRWARAVTFMRRRNWPVGQLKLGSARARICELGRTVASASPRNSFSNYSNDFQLFPKHPKLKNTNLSHLDVQEIFKLYKRLDMNMMNNFLHWPSFKFLTEFML